MRPLHRVPRRTLALAAIPLAVVFFVAFNLAIDRLLSDARIDLTADRRFTLNPATEALLEGLDEPLELRFYVSAALLQRDPAYAALAARVGAMLDSFARLSDGKIAVRRYDPKPFSPEEDLAVADGLQGVDLGGQSGEVAYFGLTGRNATDDLQTIPFFSPQRADYLEYDLAQAVAALARPEKPTVGYLGALSLLGNQANDFRPETTMGLLQSLYDLRFLDASKGSLPDDVTVAILAQPASLDEVSAYALDQFVMRGGRLLVFVDPFSEQEALAALGQYQPARGADLTGFRPLLEAWGASLDSQALAADRTTARRVLANSGGRQVVTDYIAWLALPAASFRRDDPLLAQMQVLNLNSAGILRPVPETGGNFTALASTSAEGMALPLETAAALPDPVRLLADYRAGGEPLTTIARLAGPMRSLFAGPPEALQGVEGVDFAALTAAHRASVDDGRVLVVADSDFLFDSAWLASDENGAVPVANNGEFLLNALDELRGAAGLSALRGRGPVDRPFERVEQIRRDSEQKFRAREQALLDRIALAESEIGAIEQDASGGVALTAAQSESLERLRLDLLQARRELREVQLGLRTNLERLIQRVQIFNIAAVPLAVALIGIGVALLRRRRAQARPPREG